MVTEIVKKGGKSASVEKKRKLFSIKGEKRLYTLFFIIGN